MNCLNCRGETVIDFNVIGGGGTELGKVPAFECRHSQFGNDPSAGINPRFDSVVGFSEMGDDSIGIKEGDIWNTIWG